MDFNKANHTCKEDCYVGDISHLEDGSISQYLYHFEDYNDETQRWVEDVFVGPRAIYILFDADGEYTMSCAALYNQEQYEYWQYQIVSGPFATTEQALLKAA